ncbi:MAG: aspartate/glutamate racemase family protein [Roseburia sp.]
MKKLGVIGGLGPMATAFFMQMVIEMTDARTDQEHIEMLIHNCPWIPDRTSYILGRSSENPCIPMAEIGKKLAADGAELIAIPCITANYFFDELTKQIGVPVIHSIRESVSYLRARGVKTVGVMATDGTIQSGLFDAALHEAGIRGIIPSPEMQRYVMDLIYEDVKAGRPIEMDKFHAVSEELKNNGAEVILLGCTELSMIRRDEQIGAGYLDVMQVLAKCSVELCGKLKQEYKEIITA